ncbi:MAG: hypothetical protein JXQ73_02015 [Phycisphaerae bacterium]|nr:hypothetical protein [Phycisphaerae bacterium]
MWFGHHYIFVLLSLFALMGVVLLVRGLRARVVATAPHCRGCGYNLTALSSERCPECGGVIADIGVVSEKRTRRYGLALVGLLALLPAIACLTILIGGCARQVDLYRFKPTAWVLNDAQSGDVGLVDRAYALLLARAQNGELNADELKKLYKTVLAELTANTTGGAYGHDQLLLVLSWLASTNQLPPADAAAICQGMVDVTMDIRPVCLPDAGIPVKFAMKRRRELRGLQIDYPVVWLCPPGGDPSRIPADRLPGCLGPRPGEPLPPRQLTDRPQILAQLRPGQSKLESQVWRMKADGLGDKEFTFVASLEFKTPGTNVIIYTQTQSFTLKTSVVAEPPSGIVESIDDPSLAERVRSAVSVVASRAAEGQLSGRYYDSLHPKVTIQNPPVPMGVDVSVEWPGNRLATKERIYCEPGRSCSTAATTRTGEPRPDHVDVILTPAPATAFVTLDENRIWGRPVRCERVEVVATTGRKDPFPTARTPPATPTDPRLVEAWQRSNDYEYRKLHRDEIVGLFHAFLAKHPQSPFAPEVYFELGMLYSKPPEDADRELAAKYFEKAHAHYGRAYCFKHRIAWSRLAQSLRPSAKSKSQYLQWLRSLRDSRDFSDVHPIRPMSECILRGGTPEYTPDRLQDEWKRMKYGMAKDVLFMEKAFLETSSSEELKELIKTHEGSEFGQQARAEQAKRMQGNLGRQVGNWRRTLEAVARRIPRPDRKQNDASGQKPPPAP